MQAAGRQLESFMKSPMRLLDPAFRYVPSWATDIRKTFKRASRHETARKGGSRTVVPPAPTGQAFIRLRFKQDVLRGANHDS